MHRTRFWLVGAALLLAFPGAAQAPLNTAAMDVRVEGFPIFFLHYSGVGPADRLAQGVRAALDATGPDRHGSSR